MVEMRDGSKIVREFEGTIVRADGLEDGMDVGRIDGCFGGSMTTVGFMVSAPDG